MTEHQGYFLMGMLAFILARQKSEKIDWAWSIVGWLWVVASVLGYFLERIGK